MRLRAFWISAATLFVIAGTSMFFHITQSFDMDFNQAEQFIHAQKYQRALPYLLAAFQRKPDDPRTLERLGTLFYKLSNKDALRSFSDAIWAKRTTVKTFDEQILSDISSMFFSFKQWERADYFLSELTEGRRLSKYSGLLAETRVWGKKYDLAIPMLLKLSEEEPKNIKITKLLADAYLWSQRYPAAIAAIQTVLSKEPGSKDYEFKLAEAMRCSGNNAEAVRLYKKVLGMPGK